jgi:DeoR family fructose operon transcriptional repressor
MILSLLKQKRVVTIHDLVEATDGSESTIRRDLVSLEKEKKLKRVHGGASLIKQTLSEPTVTEKAQKNLVEKTMIAKHAASLLENGDCIYLDAGTTTLQMTGYLHEKDIIVVTNGLSLIEKLLENGVKTYLLAGEVKARTRALIGSQAIESLQTYRFDKCFIGINGIHENFGYTTPDPEEAYVKKSAMLLSQEVYMLGDHSKFGEIAFSKVADLNDGSMITDNKIDENTLQDLRQQTSIEVVKS